MNTSLTRSVTRLLGALALTALLAACGGESASAPATAAMAANNGAPAVSPVASTSTASSSKASSSTSTTSSTKGSSSTATVTSDTATLAWSAPTENTDGSALTNLAGYTIYYGASASALTTQISIKTVGELDYVVQNLGSGTWYFELVAVNTSGVQSDPSSVVSVTI